MQKDKVAADLERAIQRLQDLRFEVGAQAVWLREPQPVDAIPGFILSTGYSGHGFGIAPGDMLMIGDSANDVEAARAACEPVTTAWTAFTRDPAVVSRQRESIAREIERRSGSG